MNHHVRLKSFNHHFHPLAGDRCARLDWPHPAACPSGNCFSFFFWVANFQTESFSLYVIYIYNEMQCKVNVMQMSCNAMIMIMNMILQCPHVMECNDMQCMQCM